MKYLIKIRNKINKALAPIILNLFKIFPVKKNKIMILCHNGKGFGDSCKYIVEELHKSNREYEIYWGVKKGEFLPGYVKGTRYTSLKYLYHLSTSKIWINNLRFMPYIRKRRNQFYIQTWHSSLRLKKIELDAPETITKYYMKQIKNDSRMIDIMISGCDFSYDTYKRAFLYDGTIKKTGTPRCDVFFDENKKNQLKKSIFNKYNLDFNKKTILYAPTFRDNVRCNDVYLDVDEIVDSLGENFQFLIRMHPNKKTDFEYKNKSIVDVTKYPDMQELLCAIDILITDYSGCCFDMMIANKPCILFLKDLDEYLSKERDVYFNIKSLPFIKTYKEDELLDVIENEKYKNDKVNEFKKSVGLYEDGKASSRIEKIINKVIEGDYNE